MSILSLKLQNKTAHYEHAYVTVTNHVIMLSIGKKTQQVVYMTSSKAILT